MNPMRIAELTKRHALCAMLYAAIGVHYGLG